MTKATYFYGLGRRKSSTARARLYAGKGAMTINGKTADEYFCGNQTLIFDMAKPLVTLKRETQYDITVVVSGGGEHGQAGAIRLAISNALADQNDDVRSTLKKSDLLVRDAREKERKKYGLRKARKPRQFTKR
jgi:small subunit ribosomal protein S9